MNQEMDQGLGRLPAEAPLANPYVPFQLEHPAAYPAREALSRGTLYPGLELPFMGMVNQTEKPITPLTELQALGFAIQELALYLDTHPEDGEALELYKSYQLACRNVSDRLSQAGMPLNHRTPADTAEYSWLKDPWPWEYAENKEE